MLHPELPPPSSACKETALKVKLSRPKTFSVAVVLFLRELVCGERFDKLSKLSLFLHSRCSEVPGTPLPPPLHCPRRDAVSRRTPLPCMRAHLSVRHSFPRVSVSRHQRNRKNGPHDQRAFEVVFSDSIINVSSLQGVQPGCVQQATQISIQRFTNENDNDAVLTFFCT